jgi:hypothetical protein
LLVQLSPIAGAGLCMQASVKPAEECAMPMADTTPKNDRQQSTAPQDCALMVVCAPATPVVPQVAVQCFAPRSPSPTNFSIPASLFAGDNVAPPQPPPIV